MRSFTERNGQEKTRSLHRTVGIKGLVRLGSLAGCEQSPLIVWSPSEQALAEQAAAPGCGVWCWLMGSITHRLLVTTCTHAKKKKFTLCPPLVPGSTGWPAALLADTCSSCVLRSTRRGNAVKQLTRRVYSFGLFRCFASELFYACIRIGCQSVALNICTTLKHSI